MVQDVGVTNRAVRSARILHRQVLTSSSMSFGMLPLPVIVTTRIATCLLRDPELNQYKPSFATVAERGIPQLQSQKLSLKTPKVRSETLPPPVFRLQMDAAGVHWT